MPIYCIDFGQQAVAAKNTASTGRLDSARASHSGLYDLNDAVRESRAAAEGERAVRETVHTFFEDTLGKDTSFANPVPLSRGDETLASLVVRKSLLADKDDPAANGQAMRISLLNDMWKRANGLTPNSENRLLSLASKVRYKFVDRSAKLGEFFFLHAADPTATNVLDNSLSSEAAHLQARYQGELERLGSSYIKDMHSIAGQAARELGYRYSEEEIMQMIGDYANANHILVDKPNEIQIAKWNAEADRIDSLPPEALTPGLKHKAKLFRWYSAGLSKYLNDQNPPTNLITAGYTRGEAEEIMRRVEATGINMDLVRQGVDRTIEQNSMILQEHLQNGDVSPEQYRALQANQFTQYVPLASRITNNTGFINDPMPYLQATFHRREGRNTYPDDAVTSTLVRTRRAAGAIATRPFGDMLMVLAKQNAARVGKEGDNGLRLQSLASLQKTADYDTRAIAQFSQHAEKNGGFVVNEPILNSMGVQVGSKRSIVCFDPNWVGKNGLSGAELNEALLMNTDLTPTQKALIATTGTYGQLFTRFRPWFGIVNSGRDTIERVGHIFNRDFMNADGEIIRGSSLLASYAKNVGWAYTHLAGIMRAIKNGTLDMTTKTGQYWKEYVQYGVHQDYTWGGTSDFIRKSQMQRSRELTGLPEYLQGKEASGMRQVLRQAGAVGKQLRDVLDGFNDCWNNIAAFAEFVTLRDAGVPAERAARNTLDSMDFNQQGKYTNPLRMIYPFVKPIVQSAAAMSRSLGITYDTRGIAKAGWKGWAAAACLGLGLEMAKTMATESMGYDENGLPRIDQIPLSKLSRGFPVGLGGEHGFHFFFNTGYSTPRLVSTLVWGMDRVDRGILSPEAFGGQMLLTYLQEMSPGNWPEFSFSDNPANFIVQLLAPSVAAPLVESATNMNTFGQKIKRFEAPDTIAKADYGGGTSMKVYNQLAQFVRKWFGVDAYPEQYQHAAQSLFVGPAAILRSLWESSDEPSLKNSEHYKNTHLHPALEALGLTMSFGYADDVARSLFNQAEMKLLKIIKDNRIRKTSDTAYKRGDKEGQERWWREQCRDANLDDAVADDIALYFRTEDALHVGSPQVNAYLRGRVMNDADYDSIQEDMDKSTAGRRAIMNEFVKNLKMYKR